MSRLADLLADARARCAASPTPALDAELLVAHALGRRRAWLHAWPDAHLEPAETARCEELVARRAAGEPIAYLLGEREFRSLAFAVTPDVLIPRPESEQLVELALAHLRRRAVSEPAVLELGTGSGCIAVAVAHERPDVHVTAVETSEPALQVARGNAERHGIVNVAFVRGSWYAPIGPRRFDVIVANPPYIASGDPHLGRGDLRFEPVGALDGGPDGLDALREIAAGAPHHLRPDGLVAVEHGADQGEAVSALFAAEGLVAIETHPDDAGLPRITAGCAPA